MSRAKNKGGFSLIELLVVIAVIAILIAILLPSLGAAKERVRTVVCRSNQKQIGTAINVYAADYHGSIPRGSSGASLAATDGTIWYLVLLPYVGHSGNITDYRQVDIYECDSFPRSGGGIYDISNKNQKVCYVNNAWGFTGKTDYVGYELLKPTKVSSFTNPGVKVYLADNEAGSWRPIIEDSSSYGLDKCDAFKDSHLPSSSDESNSSDGRRIAQNRHQGGCNVLYVDLHSETVSADVLTLKNFRTK